MRQKFIFSTAVLVCLAVALAPVMADERTVDRYGDRSKAAKARGAEDAVPISETFADETLSMSFESRSASAGSLSKAANMVIVAQKQDGDQAIMILNQVLSMELPDNPQSDKIITGAYERLGDLYEGAPSKQVTLYGIAINSHSVVPWLACAAGAGVGVFLCRKTFPGMARSWNAAIGEARARAAR